MNPTIKKNLFNFVLPIVAACLLLFSILKLFIRPHNKEFKPALPPPVANSHLRVGGIGIIEPKSRFIDIATQISGVAVNVPVVVGQIVQSGDPLFSLDSRDTIARLETAKANVTIAQVSLETTKSNLSFFEGISDIKAISVEELTNRRLAVKQAEAQLKQAEALVNEVETTLKILTVTAPIAGEILQVNLRIGQYANAGITDPPLIVMGDTSIMHVRVEVDEANAQWVHPNNSAIGSIRSNSSKTVPLKFEYFEPLLIQKKSLSGNAGELVDTRILQAVYSFGNQDLKSYNGQQMDVFIDVDPASKKDFKK